MLFFFIFFFKSQHSHKKKRSGRTCKAEFLRAIRAFSCCKRAAERHFHSGCVPGLKCKVAHPKRPAPSPQPPRIKACVSVRAPVMSSRNRRVHLKKKKKRNRRGKNREQGESRRPKPVLTLEFELYSPRLRQLCPPPLLYTPDSFGFKQQRKLK